MLFVYLCSFFVFFANCKHLLENPAYFQGDIILTPEERKHIYTGDRSYGASKRRNSRWPTNVIPYELEPDFANELPALRNLTNAINDFHKKTCIRFVRRTTETDYLVFHQGRGCAAPLGYHSGKNRISLQGPGCFQKGVIIHEIMHNLGFYHEQMRPDRDNYIKILWDNINPASMKDNFLKKSYSDIYSMESPYDYLSIMHYPKDGFAKRGTNTIETLDPKNLNKIGQRKGFSKLDIQQINKLYNCGRTTSKPITQIKPAGCVDIYHRCSSYKRYCNSPAWQQFLGKDCKVTCNRCGSPPTPPTMAMVAQKSSMQQIAVCADKLPVNTCLVYYRDKYCQSPAMESFMKDKCKTTCGFCKGTCGISSVQTSRVIAGKNAVPGAWPWIVSIYLDGLYHCGGTLVTPTLVVTAAHCLKNNRKPKHYYVYLGDHDRKQRDGFKQVAYISKLIKHPDYYKDYPLNNDIAVILLSTPIALNDRAKTICLPKQGEDVPVGSRCVLAGWGKTKHPGYSHDILQQAKLNIVDNKECHDFNNQMLNGSYTITPNMLCAGNGHNDRRSACHGDSGGPFVCQKNDGLWALQGVVSWGSHKCDSKQAYSVFARVSKFRQWIQQYM